MLSAIGRLFPALVKLYDDTASLQDRTVGTVLSLRWRASLEPAALWPRRLPQLRCAPAIGYPPYDSLKFDVPALDGGDVNARVWIRIREIEQSVALIEQILVGLPAGPSRVVAESKTATAGEGLGFAEGFRGDVMVSLRLGGDGRIARCHLRDPSWFQWPLLEAAIEGNIVADFPLCNKSFNCSYSGHDL